MTTNPMQQAMTLHLLRTAQRENRISLAMQPIVSAADTTKSFYHECFTRLSRRDGSLASTQDFILALEAADLAPILDLHILNMVLEQLERNPALTLACNLSSQNLATENRWRTILELIDANVHLADRLVLEVTETQPWNNIAQVGGMLDQARALGCRVALDDFGSGYASQAVLLRADFDIIKIDKAFAADIRPDASGKNSLAHIVHFASCFSKNIVVEGIETASQEALSRGAGANYLQGHLWGAARIEAALPTELEFRVPRGNVPHPGLGLEI